MTPLRDAPDAIRKAVLALNARHETETSPLDDAGLRSMCARAFLAEAVPSEDGVAAFLIAFDEAADYASPNFRWFRDRLPRFVYVDRVLVAEAARGRGLARALYDRLSGGARATGRDTIACEVNLIPPNPASDAFHARLGFTEIGRGSVGAKTVRYLTRTIS